VSWQRWLSAQICSKSVAEAGRCSDHGADSGTINHTLLLRRLPAVGGENFGTRSGSRPSRWHRGDPSCRLWVIFSRPQQLCAHDGRQGLSKTPIQRLARVSGRGRGPSQRDGKVRVFPPEEPCGRADAGGPSPSRSALIVRMVEIGSSARGR
jgi:hypothetical protein